MLGFELVKGPHGEPAKQETLQLIDFCQENDLIVLSCGAHGNVIRILIPLVTTDELLEQGLDILECGLKEICL